MNPADAYRKEQRKKEVQRNKLERKYTREAANKRDKPEEIKKELQEIIAAEESGPLSKMLKLRKKVLQEAYDHALKKKKVRIVVCLSALSSLGLLLMLMIACEYVVYMGQPCRTWVGSVHVYQHDLFILRCALHILLPL